MKINAYVKEIYPVALLMVFLMTWAVVGAGDQKYGASYQAESNRILKSSSIESSCKEAKLFPLSELACKDDQDELMVSPIFDEKNNFSRLLSKLERKENFSHQ